jgi:hypothetical protein
VLAVTGKRGTILAPTLIPIMDLRR